MSILGENIRLARYYSVKKIVIVVVSVLCLGNGVSARDCDLWDRSFYFQSTDTSPVEVKLVAGTRVITKVSFAIGRAYITLTSRYRPPNKLPSSIEDTEILLRFVYSDGMPTTLRVQHLMSSRGSSDCKGALDELREAEYHVFVRATSDGDALATRRRSIKRHPLISQDANFEVYQNQHLHIFIPKSSDKIAYIECSATPSKRLCKYVIVLRSNLVLNAAFVDFRSRGGNNFVNTRVNRLLQIFCELKIDCNI